MGERRDSEARVTDAPEGLIHEADAAPKVHVTLSDGSTKIVSTGRQYRPDPRDRLHELDETRLRGIKLVQAKRRALPWGIGPILDQGDSSECTVFTFAQFLQCAPWIHTLAWVRGAFTERYTRAQKHDGIARPHDGSTERAVLMDAKEDGLITEFLHVNDEDIAKEYLVTRGTLAFGSDWFGPMFTPDAHGYVEPEHTPAEMGHEYLMRWYYGPRHRKYPDSYEFVNSWSAQWGDKGKFRMKADAVRYLWKQLNGDLISPIEAARSAKRSDTRAVIG